MTNTSTSKGILFLFIFFFSINYLNGQTIEYTYDSAGNRIQKKLILNGPGDEEPGDFEARKSQQFLDSLNGIQVKIYPNPTAERVIVEIDQNISVNAEIILIDIKGNIIQQSTNLSKLNEFDLTHQPSGNFVLRLINEKKVSSYIIVKK